MSDAQPPLLLATDSDATRALAIAIGAEFAALPDLEDAEALEAWRVAQRDGPARDRVVVAIWPGARSAPASAAALLDLDANAWRARFEAPYLAWNLALGAAAERVADGGAIVAVIQTPAALDAAGWVPEMSIGDGVIALVRSISQSEGVRGVRTNAVTTPWGLVGSEVVAPLPPLDTFPGRIDVEVAGSVRLLLSEDAIGLTGRVLAADCGRAQP